MLHWWSFLQGQTVTAPQITFSANPWCSDPAFLVLPCTAWTAASHGNLGETSIRREGIILKYSFLLNTPSTPTSKEQSHSFRVAHFSSGHTLREPRGKKAPSPYCCFIKTRDQNIPRASPFPTFCSEMFSLESILGHAPAVSDGLLPIAGNGHPLWGRQFPPQRGTASPSSTSSTSTCSGELCCLLSTYPCLRKTWAAAACVL